MLMTHRNGLRSIGALSALGVGAIALSGCLGPTYGTDKTAGAQLMEDLTTSVSLKRKDRTVIQYNPRPDLVRPEDTSALPQPQQNIVEASDQWPESQEERLARIRREADEGKVRSNLVRRVDDDDKNKAPGRVASASEVRESTPARRIYLTDPPSEFRKPAETAAYGDLGVDESTKERARKKAGGNKGGWRRFIPGL